MEDSENEFDYSINTDDVHSVLPAWLNTNKSNDYGSSTSLYAQSPQPWQFSNTQSRNTNISQLNHRRQPPMNIPNRTNVNQWTEINVPQNTNDPRQFRQLPYHRQQLSYTGSSAGMSNGVIQPGWQQGAHTNSNALSLVNSQFGSNDLTEVDPAFLPQTRTGALGDVTSTPTSTAPALSKTGLTACVIISVIGFLVILILLIVTLNKVEDNSDAISHMQYITVFDGRFNSHCPPVVCNMTCDGIGRSSSSSSSSSSTGV
jgi:hypothetical protein